MKITTGKRKRAQKVVLYGTEGIGKTTLASKFPSPLFIDTEGGSDHLDVARTDRPASWTQLVSFIREFISLPGGFKTLVIDTIDWAEQLCVNEICSKHNKKGIEDFGYGNGYTYVAEEFGRFLNLLDEVIDQGVNVVLTAHAQIKKFEQPDEMSAYDRFELKLGKKTTSKTAPLVKEWADMVLFGNYKNEVLTTSSNKKKAVDGKRLLYTTHSPAWDAKNRHGLPNVVPFEYESIAHVIPDDLLSKSCIEELAKDSSLPKDIQDEVKSLHVETQGTVIQDDNPFVESEEIPKALKQLMVKDSITLAQLKQVIFDRGKYPVETPIANYETGFVEGWIIPNWDKIVELVKKG